MNTRATGGSRTTAAYAMIAGTLEGFVSPIETWPLSWKLAVSGATAAFLAIYLSGGRARRAEPSAVVSGEDTTSEMLGLGAHG